MDKMGSVVATCKTCKSALNPQHLGPCPHCGRTGKDVKVNVNETICISDRVEAILKGTRIRKNYKMLGIILGGSVLITSVGHVVDHPLLIVGGYCSIFLSLIYGYKAYDKFKFEKAF